MYDSHSYDALRDMFDNGTYYDDLFDEYIDKSTRWNFLKKLQPVSRIIDVTSSFFFKKILRHFEYKDFDRVDFKIEMLEDNFKKETAIIGKDVVLAYYIINLKTGDVDEHKFFDNPFCDLTPIKHNWREEKLLEQNSLINR